MTDPRYLEDFVIGETFHSGPVSINLDQIKAFASEFGPQPFHTDEQAAPASLFGALVASGWHTAALTMKLFVASPINVAGGLIGVGAEDLKWPRPVLPGDVLSLEIEVLEIRPSQSKPNRGLIKLRSTTLNQASQPVMLMLVTIIAPRRTATDTVPAS